MRKNKLLLSILTVIVSSLICSNILAQEKGKTINLTKADFLSKVFNYEKSKTWNYSGDKPAIIDFYASWCGACRIVAPMLESLAKEYGEDIYIYKVDVEKEKELAAAFGVQSLPTLIFIPMDGKPIVAQGAVPKNNLKEGIEKLLLGK